MSSSGLDGHQREDADIETSSEGYARRFAGSVGSFFFSVQAKATLDLLSPWPHARVLEVGGGHGQLIGPLIEAGFSVTVLGSAPVCRERIAAWIDNGKARFVAADLLHLPFPDRRFQVALAFRLLPHLSDWKHMVGELCRVADRAVIVDYPTQRSVNAFADALFGLKKGVEKNTRPFTVFRDSEIDCAFAAHGFSVTARRPQFLFPMALHRALRRAWLSRVFEAGARFSALTRALGSPVVLRAERDVPAVSARP